VGNNQLQFKYLDAGAKSSIVVIDSDLSTSNDQTLYLFHRQRNQIIEYRRDIVEAKLRELTAEEQKMAKELQQAYQQARAQFTPRGAAAQLIPESAPPAKPSPARDTMDDSDDSDDDIGLIDDDDLMDDEDEEDED